MKKLLCFHLSMTGVTAALFSRRRKSLIMEKGTRSLFAASPFQSLPFGGRVVDGNALTDALTQVGDGMDERRSTLVIPDSWIRTLILNVENLPRKREEVQNLISWRLQKILNVETADLRFVHHVIPPDVKGESRIMVHVTLDKLMAYLEETFHSLERDVGAITSRFWALAPSLERNGVWGLLTLEEGLWSIGYFRGGDVLFFRQRLLPSRERETLYKEVERTWNYFYKRWDMPLEKLNIWFNTGEEDLDTTDHLRDLTGWAIEEVDLSSIVTPGEGVEGIPSWLVRESVVVGAARRHV